MYPPSAASREYYRRRLQGETSEDIVGETEERNLAARQQALVEQGNFYSQRLVQLTNFAQGILQAMRESDNLGPSQRQNEVLLETLAELDDLQAKFKKKLEGDHTKLQDIQGHVTQLTRCIQQFNQLLSCEEASDHDLQGILSECGEKLSRSIANREDSTAQPRTIYAEISSQELRERVRSQSRHIKTLRITHFEREFLRKLVVRMKQLQTPTLGEKGNQRLKAQILFLKNLI